MESDVLGSDKTIISIERELCGKIIRSAVTTSVVHIFRTKKEVKKLVEFKIVDKKFITLLYLLINIW